MSYRYTVRASSFGCQVITPSCEVARTIAAHEVVAMLGPDAIDRMEITAWDKAIACRITREEELTGEERAAYLVGL